ncbi:ferrous iron transport protein B [Desulfovibrio inopinatus]|uniref:ferrous iron transport protein B n=1 Tax=Desulfovibrio inopinatus TaxID=102109 RepID=UPI0004042D2F|nr:ferrous iron transport protein B [Desulfovibrio inopinatus]
MNTHSLTFALAGNPNCGKTTMFNALTGSRQHVGNFPGVTVEKKVGVVRHNGESVSVVDLPGAYSLTAYSQEEVVARNYLVNEKPDVVVDVMDASALERSLYLAVQFMELGVPLVLALNMMDEVKKSGRTINTSLLAQRLGVPVVETVARAGQGKGELLREAITLAASTQPPKPLVLSYGQDLDEAILKMVNIIEQADFLTQIYPPRWLAVKYLEGDEEVIRQGRQSGPVHKELEAIAEKTSAHCRTTLNVYPEALVADARYGFINSLLRNGVVKRNDNTARRRASESIDAIATNTFAGPLIMLGILYLVYEITFQLGETPMGWVEALFGWMSATAEASLPEGFFRSLIVSGVIDGVGGVMGFVPLIAIMFIMISILEDSGYMARMAYMLDRVFRIFGLHGSSVMPFIVSGGIAGGCAVPGVMAARTLRSEKERLATILTAPFMNCGAKIPVFLLLTAAFFPKSGTNVMFLITLAAWGVALLAARILRSTVIRGDSTPFLMELPPYRLPTVRGVLLHSLERTWMYIKKAGTIILAISILLWAAMTFPGLPEHQAEQFELHRQAVAAQIEAGSLTEDQAEAELFTVDNAEAQAGLRYSLAGRVGTFLETITRAAGFDWRVNIALLGGVAAKEVIVSTLGTAYSMGDVDPEDTSSLSERLASDPIWTTPAALALIVFVMLYAPCFVTVVAIAREVGWGWAAFSVGFNTVLAMAAAIGVYQIGTLL